MKICKKPVIHFVLLQLLFVFHLMNVHAQSKWEFLPIYHAVKDTKPGIWVTIDADGDGDALDPGETIQVAQGHKFRDVAVDEFGILYAIEEGTGIVYRMEDLNQDGDFKDTGEVGIFHDSSAVGIRFEAPLCIAATSDFDPDMMTTRAVVTVMDLAHLGTYRLQDLNGDNDAQDPGETVTIIKSSSGAPFIPVRMSSDELGNIVASEWNSHRIVRLDDVNMDGEFSPPKVEYCPSTSCGAFWSDEYKVIRKYQMYQSINLDKLFGVAPSFSPKHNSLVYFVSDDSGGMSRVLKLIDLNDDDDALDEDEVTLWAYAWEASTVYDLVCDAEDFCFVAYENWDGTGDAVAALHDNNDDGDARDSGERWAYADFSGIGTPVGLATMPPPSRPQMITPDLADESPLKGPLLVVEDGETVSLAIDVSYRDTGDAAEGVRVGHAVVAGCFELCPQSYRTEPGGKMEYLVRRTATSPVGGELLKFWVFGDEVTVPVVSTPCTPVPEAIGGPDKEVPVSQVVVLDASLSIGAGLHYCWEQLDGPDVGLPDCDFTTTLNPNVTFTAPSSPSPPSLLFGLTVHNACDLGDTDEVTVEVYSCSDSDGDGYLHDACVGGADCDDTDPAVNPGADEVCDNGIDDDCDGLVDGQDPDCAAEFTLDLNATYVSGSLNLIFTLGTPEPATWANYLIIVYPTVQVFPLWTVSLPVIYPPMGFPVSFPLPGLGWIGIWTGLFKGSDLEAFDLEWVDTGT